MEGLPQVGQVNLSPLPVANDTEDAQREAEQKAIEEQRQWEKEVASARLKYVERYRQDVLHEEVSRFERAKAIRDYSAGMLDAFPIDPSTAAWAAWASAHADAIDPLISAPATPKPPDPTPEQLRPYLSDGMRRVRSGPRHHA